MLKNIFGSKKPKEKYSLENMKYLYGQLIKEPIITNSNKARIVEVLRSIAELVVWGDQKNPQVFEFFAEKNILSNFVRILSQKCDNKVKVQIIQTLSILVQNISNEVSIFYLLSNNYINDMIVHRFDFADEEICTYYINFLKSLSFKLNKRTILFFYNEHAQDFPLFNEAIKFFNHPESMIRIAVRTLSLNIFKINDLSLRRYILTKNSVPYFSHLIWFLRDQTIAYDKLMHQPNVALSKLEVQMEHLLDQLYYLQDILNCNEGNEENPETGGFQQRDDSAKDGAAGADESSSGNSAVGGLYFQHLISEVLIDQLLGYYILPLLIGSLVPSQSKIPAHLLISTRLSLFMLNQILGIFQHFSFLNTILSVLVRHHVSLFTLKLIQEPPRGPVRNSDGSPLTDLLYQKSSGLRKANVEQEIALLAEVPTSGKKHNRFSSTPSISSQSLHTPNKPSRDREHNMSVGSGTMFDTPSPPMDDTADGPNASKSPPSSSSAQQGSETELQPIALKITTNASASPENSVNESEISVIGAPPSQASTTEASGSGSRRNSASSSALSSEPSVSSALAPGALDFFAASAGTPVTATPAASSNATSMIAPTPLPPAPLSPLPQDGWPCPACTYNNPPTFLTCAICEQVRPATPKFHGGSSSNVVTFPIATPVHAVAVPDVNLSEPLSPAAAPASGISNAGLANAYLSPASAAANNASFSGSASATSSPQPALSASKSPPGPREIPVDENSKARSKLPEVGPLYSPIDYFQFVLKSEPLPSNANNLPIPPNSFTPQPPSTHTIPGLTATVELDPRVLQENEVNEYRSALLHFLSLAQSECLSQPASSPVHVQGSSLSPSQHDDLRAMLDERDLYGSLSVIHSVFSLPKDRVDLEMLVSEDLCSQSHRTSGKLLAALVSSGSTKDILGLVPRTSSVSANGDPLQTPGTIIRSRAGTQNDMLFSSPVHSTGGDAATMDKILDDDSSASGIAGGWANGPKQVHMLSDGFGALDFSGVAPSSGSPATAGAPRQSSPPDLLSGSHEKSSPLLDKEKENDLLQDDGLESAPEPSSQQRVTMRTPIQSDSPADEKMDDTPNPANGAPVTVTSDNFLDLLSESRTRAESSDPLMQKSTQRRAVPTVQSGSSSSAPGAHGKCSSSSVSAGSASAHKGPLFADLELDGLAQEKLGEDGSVEQRAEYNHEFVSQLLNLANHHPPYRMVTLQTALELVKESAFPPPPSAYAPAAIPSGLHPLAGKSILSPEHQEQLERIYMRLVEDLRSKLSQPLVNLFLIDLIEEEYATFTSFQPVYTDAGKSLVSKIRSNVANLMPIETGYAKDVPMDYRVQSSGLVTLQPPQSLIAGANGVVALTPSVSVTPSNEVERLRKSVQVLLMLRNLRLKNLRQRDMLFYAPPSNDPIPVNTSPALQHPQTQLFHESILSVSQEILTAHHPDAMLCTLQVEPKKKLHLFFVMDEWDLVLVELQQNKPGTAIVQLRQSLRHQEAFLNRNNACLLHVTIRSSSRPHPAARKLQYSSDVFFKPLWVVSLLFLDAIQCARAWKHLDARRMTLRKNILGKLCNELTIPIDEPQMQSISVACTTIQMYPGIEQDVHQDSLLFGIPVANLSAPVGQAVLPGLLAIPQAAASPEIALNVGSDPAAAATAPQ